MCDTICVICSTTNLLSTHEMKIPPGERGCINCNKLWDDEYIKYMFGKKVYTQFKLLANKNLLERELSLLPASQDAAKYEKLKREINAQNEVIKEKILEVELQRTKLLREYEKNEDKLEQQQVVKSVYIFPCPVEVIDEDGNYKKCKGLIVEDDMTCSVCSAVVCRRCHVHIPSSSTGTKGRRTKAKKHVCKQEDVKSAKTVLDNTKGCPTCASRIQKIDGCSQMFCTNCMTAFDWDTLQIVKGAIHNPHYYNMVRNGQIAPLRRQTGDIPCGGLADLGYYIGYKTSLHDSIYSLYRIACEVEDYLDNLTGLKSNAALFEELRVKYILDDIKTEDEYMEELLQLKKRVEKFSIEQESLTTFLACFIDRLLELKNTVDEVSENTKGKKMHYTVKNRIINIDSVIEDLTAIIDMTNEIFEANDIPLLPREYNTVLTFLRTNEIIAEAANARGFNRVFGYGIFRNMINLGYNDLSDDDIEDEIVADDEL